MLQPEFKTTLKDGTTVRIRTLDPCDKKCIADGFDRLSIRSRHLRFFSPINKLSEAQLTYLADVDNVNHAVIAATAEVGEGATGVGLARYIRLKQDPDVAEFAISITDDFQGRGLGSILQNLLVEHARSNSIRILRGYVLKSNKPMIKLLERYNAQCSEDEDGSLRFDIQVNT